MSQFSQSDPPDGETPAELPVEAGPGERMRVVLFLLHRGGAEMVTLVPGIPLVVGRKPPSDICVRDAKLSRTHARFCLSQDSRSILVEDLGSTNGTWLGTQRIQSTPITFGQEVRLGGVLARPQVFKDSPTFSYPGEPSHDKAVVAGRAMRALMEQVERVAASRLPIVIYGETGTGKEVLAELLHKLGRRADKPMKRINCGAIPTHLVESTLFGHERGAFTGAVHQHKGLFEEAHGGMVFLDEIGELAQPAQTALLHVLETGQLTRVGSSREISVDVRVIAATHRDLYAMVQKAQFREDLYYRLSPLTLELPPLRERTDEIETLARHFLQEANRENRGRIKGIAPSAMEQLLAYSWPGNVRELKNVISGAALISRSSHISVHDLPARVVRALGASQSPPSTSQARRMEDAAPVAGESSGELRHRVLRYEAQIIRETLESVSWNRAKAARLLKLPLRTLAHRIKVLGIKKDQP
jgi:two-component system response regulator AtoC